MAESIVEIPEGSGNKYRYTYDSESQKTRYLGSVGSAPAMDEQEFFAHTLSKEGKENLILHLPINDYRPEEIKVVEKTMTKVVPAYYVEARKPGGVWRVQNVHEDEQAAIDDAHNRYRRDEPEVE